MIENKMVKMEKRKQPKYVERGLYNKPLPQPRHTRTRVIYTAVEDLLTHGGNFLPTRDSTDHFHFACEKCHSMADVLKVEFYPRYGGNRKLYAIFFWLGCPDCGNTGFRKIYLKPSSYFGQECFTYDREVFVYGDGRKPVGQVKLHPIKTKDENSHTTDRKKRRKRET